MFVYTLKDILGAIFLSISALIGLILLVLLLCEKLEDKIKQIKVCFLIWKEDKKKKDKKNGKLQFKI